MKFTGGLATVKPESVAASAETEAVFDAAIDAAIEAYQKLLAAGVPAEDARYLLPNAAETKIVITMNVRELLHFFELRCCTPGAVGNPRDGAPHAGAGAPHGAVRVRGRGCALRARAPAPRAR